MNSSSERQNILGRIREALRVQAPRPGHSHAPASHTPDKLPEPSAFSQWLPAVGNSFQQRLEQFQTNALNLKADFFLFGDLETLLQKIKALRDAEGWTRIASHAGELTDKVCHQLNLPVCRTDVAYDPGELESCGAGITQCDALIAQTGSVLVTNRSAGGRALSVLPPHHVVLARREQLLSDLPQAFAVLKSSYGPDYPSFISFITGPSRTGDIERILVLGAHGPKKLTILCV